MGKGDKKTKRGKISSGSYGVTRKRKKKVTFIAKPKARKVVKKQEEVESVVKKTTKKATPKKASAKTK